MTPLYRVLMKRGRRWQLWNNYHVYESAVEAASALVQGGHTKVCQISKVTTDAVEVVAVVKTQPAVGWEYGRAVVTKQ